MDGVVVSVLDGAAGLDEAAAVPQTRELAWRAGPRDQDVRALDGAVDNVLQKK